MTPAAPAAPPPPDPPQYAWLDGELVRFDDCLVHARSQGAFWGANVFEGLRAYRLAEPGRLSLFRLDDHLDRLRRSMKSLHMPSAYDDDEIRRACLDVLAANAFGEDAHVCVTAYFGFGRNFDPLCYTEDVGMHITTTRAPRSPGFDAGVRASISSWRRIGDDVMPPRIKTGANYHNSRLAHHEAIRNGFDTTLLLNARGTVSEAPGSCVVMVRDGRLVTPPGTSGVLEGITLESVAQLALEERGWELERREIDRSELYVAEEIFVCGTLAEIQPVVEIDRVPVGDGAPGPITRTLQELYDAAVRADPSPHGWSTPVADAVPDPRPAG